ncbi:copper homeostasis protein CutC [Litoribacter ruber]|uniref:copper homeostasis protein CutC n=1 Tax=Litoribacter ruber TaxID=702568 RepID=UPI001BD9C824|nr:copper homeostasis protein CutC [Litoribacter ruber]MBT0810529.1 copper homeostasis protein CutC [Litoribacter ruber]
MRTYLLEAPVFSLHAGLKAASAGVDRLELCADFAEGGTTPSIGVFRVLQSLIQIPIFVMIRPRGGDFVYSEREIAAMIEDIKLFDQEGADGFVFGVQTPQGGVDLISNKSLIKATKKPCTFHRAFDNMANHDKALEEIISLGFTRILSSGGFDTVTDGMENLLKWMKIAGDRIIIMPGGGSKPSHLETFKKVEHFKEIHASCKKVSLGPEHYHNHLLKISSSEGILDIDEEIVLKFKSA